MVVLLGIAAFAIDGSFLYTERNRMAAAADAAAKSAAIELKRRPGISDADLAAFAQHEVIAQGFAAGDVVVHHPPVSPSAFAGQSAFVQAHVSRPTTTFFASVVNAAWSSVSPVASAVAGASAPGNCVIANGNVDVKNNTTLTGCSMAVGGNLSTDNGIGGTPTPNVVVTGSCTGSCTNVTTGQPKPSDPFNGLAAPTVTGVGCPGGIAAAVTNPLPSGCYTSIPAGVTTLATGGSFKVSGPFNINASTTTGTNVLVYLTGTGSIVAQNNSTLTLTAQTSGTYQGIALYGAAGSSIGPSNVPGFTMNVGGAIYMPGGDIDLKNSFNVNPIGNCLLVVINNYSAKNNGTFNSTATGCYSTFGGAVFLGVAIAE